MSFSEQGAEGGEGFTVAGFAPNQLDAPLMSLLGAASIVPGSQPSYQTCKTILAYHPLGAKMTSKPVELAQSQPRTITVATEEGVSNELVEAFNETWATLGGSGADAYIKSVATLSRAYGIATVVVGERGKDPSTPLDLVDVAKADLYFNVLDPLNTSGSLVIDQEPNSPDFLKPTRVRVGPVDYHASRACVTMNEQPLYIEWTTSGFGFVGRSVFQRVLYPLKTFLECMVTDDAVVKKIALLIWKSKAPGSIVNQKQQRFWGWKRQQLKSGVTGQVMTIGESDTIESINFTNLEGPYRLTRENVMNTIAMGAGMPSKLLQEETLVGGMAEGSEDAKQIARYVDRVRIELSPLYRFFDRIVMRRAWTPEFYEGLRAEFPSLKGKSYEAFLGESMAGFKAEWPNFLSEPDSEKSKKAQAVLDSVVKVLESMTPLMDPENQAELIEFAVAQINELKEFFTVELGFEIEPLLDYLTEQADQKRQAAEAASQPQPGTPGGDEDGVENEPKPSLKAAA